MHSYSVSLHYTRKKKKQTDEQTERKAQHPVRFLAEENKQAGRTLKKSIANVSKTSDGWSGVSNAFGSETNFLLLNSLTGC